MAAENPSRKAANNEKGKEKDKDTPPLIPPDERFWQRYSPNHEFPLSSASSAVLHVLVLGILALAGFGFIYRDGPVDVDALVIGGGGGRPDGDDGLVTGKGPKHEDLKDIADSASPTRQKLEMKGEALTEVQKLSKSLIKPEDERRFIDDDFAMGKKLTLVGEQVRERINTLQQGVASKGLGGPGKGGGKGKGTGTGFGDAEGPGRGTINKRQERQSRWTMIFNIRDPEDYARQLHALGAVLAVPGENGQYMVIEDLSARPVVARPKDISEINRMFWVDDKAGAVEPLFRVLEYRPIPTYFVAFFPLELERDLLKKELEYKRLPEGKIKETRFQVRRSNSGRYEPYVVEQEEK
jgi:hypothetical protein